MCVKANRSIITITKGFSYWHLDIGESVATSGSESQALFVYDVPQGILGFASVNPGICPNESWVCRN